MLPLLAALACESMPSTGKVFAPVVVPVTASPADQAAHDELFDPEPGFKVTSEQLAAGSVPPAGETAPSTEPPTTPASAPVAGVPSPPAPTGVPPRDPWPVRLVSTVAAAQPPRAILGTADGRELVVTPGSLLAEQGLVVMAVTDGRVTVARVRPDGDHAAIESVELVAQYGGP